jgi:hypothetical protein
VTALKQRINDSKFVVCPFLIPKAHNLDFRGEAVHTVCSILKQYLREMPDPVCTFEYVEEFVYAGTAEDRSEQLELLHDLINNSIPKANATTLEFLISFLLYVTVVFPVSHLLEK